MQKYKQGEGGFPQKRGWKEKVQRSFSEHSSKPFAGLRGPHPRLLSFHEESNQRRAKEEVSSLETPLRGTSPRELRLAKFSPPDFPITKWLLGFVSVELRAVGTYVERTCYRYRGVSKGACPFREVFQTSEVKEPGGSLCALCETFFTQESFRRCGLRKPTKNLCTNPPVS